VSPATPSDNPFARIARLDKAKRYTTMLDAFAASEGIDPLLEADRVITEIWPRLTESSWAAFAAMDRKGIAGPETRALVRQTYLDRARLTGRKLDTTYSEQPRLRLVQS
jgi:hypothetical protein